MAIQWTKRVAQANRLTVFMQASVGGKWKTAIQDAVDQFNRLSAGVPVMTFVSEAKRANVEVVVGNGNVKVKYDGQEFSKTVVGIRPAGFTRLLHTKGGPIEKAFVLLPATPMINAPGKTRHTGIKVMTFIALHELIHACGLEDADHTPGDVFEGNPSLRLGNGPDQDLVEVTEGRNRKVMPPFQISSQTLGKISRNWSSASGQRAFAPLGAPGFQVPCTSGGRQPVFRY